MLVILFFGLIATCTAVPQTIYRSEYDRPFVYHSYYNPDGPVIYDMDGFETHIGNRVGNVFPGVSQKLPDGASTQGIQGNQYKVTMSLSGFLKKDIRVKTSPGLMTVQAMRAMPHGSYLEITKQLPPYVNTSGLWSYETGVLSVVFPLNPGTQTQGAGAGADPRQATEAPVTNGGAPAPAPAVHAIVQDSRRQ